MSQNQEERNYHIFFFLCRGATPEMAAEVGLMGPAESYHYLNQTGDASYVDGMDDVAEFQDVVHSLDVRVCVCVCFTSYIRDSADSALLQTCVCVSYICDSADLLQRPY